MTTAPLREKRHAPRAMMVRASALVFIVFLFSVSRVALGQQDDDDDFETSVEEDNNDNGENKFWNTGPSGIDESILPPLDPTNYPCPKDRYLLLGPRTYTGGFNNMFMTFQSAILLARYTNRTFVIPAARNDRYTDFRFSQAIDYEVRRASLSSFLSLFSLFLSLSLSFILPFLACSQDCTKYLTFDVLSPSQTFSSMIKYRQCDRCGRVFTIVTFPGAKEKCRRRTCPCRKEESSR